MKDLVKCSVLSTQDEKCVYTQKYTPAAILPCTLKVKLAIMMNFGQNLKRNK